MAGIFHRKRSVIPPPKNFGVNAAGQPLAKGIEDRAFGVGVGRSIGMRVVRYLVHIHAQHVRSVPTQHGGSRAVDKDAPTVHVDAKYALASGIQQQIELVLPQGACAWHMGKR